MHEFKIFNDGKYRCIYCSKEPECVKPEEKRKKLVDILSEESKNAVYATGNLYWKPFAEAALKAVEEVIDSIPISTVYHDEIKSKLRELL